MGVDSIQVPSTLTYSEDTISMGLQKLRDTKPHFPDREDPH